MEDIHQAETSTMISCRICNAGLLEHDKFCRRCGASQNLHAADAHPHTAQAAETSPLAAGDPYHKVSGPLVKAVTEAARAHASLHLYNRIASSLVLTLISIPVWLIIILLSPLDAYAAAREVTSHLARH